jgi:GNAT superfamily N-acetyltransferase
VPEVTFRQATAADIAAVVALLADDIKGRTRERVEDPVATCYAEAFARIAASPDNELILADLDGRIVGTMQLTRIPGLSRQGLTRVIVESVRVASDLRGQGIGETMMRHAIARSKQWGAQLIQLTSDTRRTDAHRFYERLGFEKSHAGFKLML